MESVDTDLSIELKPFCHRWKFSKLEKAIHWIDPATPIPRQRAARDGHDDAKVAGMTSRNG
jgi:hypothetical protein